MTDGNAENGTSGETSPQMDETVGSSPDTVESTDSDLDPLDAAEVDWEMAPDSDAEFPDDPERREFLRTIAADIRGESSESKQVAAILYRVSDLYDPNEDTSPEEIYLNVRHIMTIKAEGGLNR